MPLFKVIPKSTPVYILARDKGSAESYMRLLFEEASIDIQSSATLVKEIKNVSKLDRKSDVFIDDEDETLSNTADSISTVAEYFELKKVL
jgi:hypothetical protein